MKESFFRKLQTAIPKVNLSLETTILEGNRGFIYISKNDIENDRSKYLDIKYQMVMDDVKAVMVKLEYI